MCFFLVMVVGIVPFAAAGGGKGTYRLAGIMFGYGLGLVFVFYLAKARFDTTRAGAVGPWRSLPRIGPWLAVTTLGLTSCGFALGVLLYLYVPGCQVLPPEEPGGWMSVMVAALAAPLVEELLFRGVMLRTMLVSYRPAFAISLSAILFAVVHVYPMKFPHILLHGLLWGWCYWKTRSIWPGVLGHMTNNVSGAQFDPPKQLGDLPIAAMLMLGSVVAVIGIWHLRPLLEAEAFETDVLVGVAIAGFVEDADLVVTQGQHG